MLYSRLLRGHGNICTCMTLRTHRLIKDKMAVHAISSERQSYMCMNGTIQKATPICTGLNSIEEQNRLFITFCQLLNYVHVSVMRLSRLSPSLTIREVEGHARICTLEGDSLEIEATCKQP